MLTLDIDIDRQSSEYYRLGLAMPTACATTVRTVTRKFVISGHCY